MPVPVRVLAEKKMVVKQLEAVTKTVEMLSERIKDEHNSFLEAEDKAVKLERRVAELAQQYSLSEEELGRVKTSMERATTHLVSRMYVPFRALAKDT